LQELSVGLEFLGFHQSEEDDFLNDDGKVEEENYADHADVEPSDIVAHFTAWDEERKSVHNVNGQDHKALVKHLNHIVEPSFIRLE
jgi:hypothetical protein